jgi:hypothetical protein
MNSALIKFSYTQTIDSTAATAFEKNVLRDSYAEFLLKSQVYNPESKYKTFTEMVNNDGRANSLHYKSGFAITNHINQLDSKVPGLKLSFDIYEFKIIESDITNAVLHKVALIYTTGIFTLLDSINDTLLIAPGNQSEKILDGEEIENTFLLKLIPGRDIVSYAAVLTVKIEI